MESSAPAHPLVGHRLPPGHLRIQRYEDWLARDAIGATVNGERPHAMWTVLGVFRGLGVDLAEFFSRLETTAEAGVLFGETRIEQVRPLEYDHDYAVQCEVTGVTRRHGSTVSVFDLVAYRVEIEDDQGVSVRCSNTFVVPRSAA